MMKTETNNFPVHLSASRADRRLESPQGVNVGLVDVNHSRPTQLRLC